MIDIQVSISLQAKRNYYSNLSELKCYVIYFIFTHYLSDAALGSVTSGGWSVNSVENASIEMLEGMVQQTGLILLHFLSVL